MVSEEDFRTIVDEVASELYGVVRASAGGYSAVVAFRSGSKKSNWEAHMDFDPQTWHCTIWSPYPDAGLIRTFSRMVVAKVRAAESA